MSDSNGPAFHVEECRDGGYIVRRSMAGGDNGVFPRVVYACSTMPELTSYIEANLRNGKDSE